MEERRRSQRIAADGGELAVLPVSLTVQVLDISVSGVLLESSRSVASGVRGLLKLTIGGHPFVADVQVHRVSLVSDARGRGGYHIGVTFVTLSPEHRQLIERFTNQ